MQLNKYWAGDLEIQLTSFIFDIEIALFNSIIDVNNNTLYKCVSTFNLNQNSEFNKPIMMLLHINNNHYELLYFKDKKINKVFTV